MTVEFEPLTDKEREHVRRLLSDPLSFPEVFVRWIDVRETVPETELAWEDVTGG